MATCNPVYDERKIGSIGLPLPDTDVRLLAPGDQVLAVLRSGKEEDLRKLLLKPVK